MLPIHYVVLPHFPQQFTPTHVDLDQMYYMIPLAHLTYHTKWHLD